MGSFRFLLAFRFHWHSASPAPELALDGRLPLPAGMNGEHRNLFGAAPCSCGANPALGTPLEPNTKDQIKDISMFADGAQA